MVDPSSRFTLPARMSIDPQKALQAAIGYLQLGLLEEAGEEIESLPPELRTTEMVFQLRAEISMKHGAWALLTEVAGTLVDRWPGKPQYWIWMAYGTRRCRTIEEAEFILLQAAGMHPGEAVIHYNLACYAAQTGKLDDARERLATATRLDAAYQAMALNDPDLEPLW